MKQLFTIGMLTGFMVIFSLDSNAQGFGVVVDSAEVPQNDMVCVPVRAKGFLDISSYQYSLSWDKQVLKFDHTQNFNLPGLNQQYFHETTPGTLLLGWDHPMGLSTTMADSAILFEVCFLATGPQNSSTQITPGSNGSPPGNGGAEAFNFSNVNVWSPNLIKPGYVRINGILSADNPNQKASFNFQLSPNPTQSGALVSLISDSIESGNLSVIDMQGRVVYREQVFINQGENVFKIPENVLITKGLYQIVMETGDGFTGRILEVH